MKKTIQFLLISFLATTSLSLAAGIGAFWATIDADTLGESEGYGVLLNLRLDGKTSLDLRYSQFKDFDATPAILDYEITPIEALYLINLSPINSFNPYLGAGVGYYQLDGTAVSGESLDLDDEFGWILVGGATFKLTQSLHLFGEAVYRKVEGKVKNADVSFDGVDSDEATLKMDGLGFNAGIVLRW